MYSPRISYPDGEVLQSFTAIGVVTSGHIYQVEMTPEFNWSGENFWQKPYPNK